MLILAFCPAGNTISRRSPFCNVSVRTEISLDNHLLDFSALFYPLPGWPLFLVRLVCFFHLPRNPIRRHIKTFPFQRFLSPPLSLPSQRWIFIFFGPVLSGIVFPPSAPCSPPHIGIPQHLLLFPLFFLFSSSFSPGVDDVGELDKTNFPHNVTDLIFLEILPC